MWGQNPGLDPLLLAREGGGGRPRRRGGVRPAQARHPPGRGARGRGADRHAAHRGPLVLPLHRVVRAVPARGAVRRVLDRTRAVREPEPAGGACAALRRVEREPEPVGACCAERAPGDTRARAAGARAAVRARQQHGDHADASAWSSVSSPYLARRSRRSAAPREQQRRQLNVPRSRPAASAAGSYASRAPEPSSETSAPAASAGNGAGCPKRPSVSALRTARRRSTRAHHDPEDGETGHGHSRCHPDHPSDTCSGSVEHRRVRAAAVTPEAGGRPSAVNARLGRRSRRNRSASTMAIADHCRECRARIASAVRACAYQAACGSCSGVA